MGGSVKIFKKSSSNGRVYIYLAKREYVQCDGTIEPVQGIAFLQDWKEVKHLVVQLVVTFRHGREEDETMGISFKKELIIDRFQANPSEKHEGETKVQSVLQQKLGDGAIPFTLNFPELAPNSVLICASEDEDPSKRQMGVFYDVRVHTAESADDFIGKKGSTVSMGIRKSQFVSVDHKQRSPTSSAEKGFVFGSGKLVLEASLDKEVFYHGEDIPVHLSINNHSKKQAKSVACMINQNCELSIVNQHYSCKVARLESKDGCPLQPGGTLNRTIKLKPLAQICQGMKGICLDASLSKSQGESNLASSSLSEGGDNDLLGLIVSYTIKVKVVIGGMGGELETDLPFKLVHPRPNSQEMENLKREKDSANATNQRRKLFQGQDSVLQESLKSSQDLNQ